MFASFLKPRWQHRDPAVRLRALATLQPGNAEHDKALVTLARGDASEQVRAAACHYLGDISLLGQIEQQDRDVTVRNAAAVQIQKLLAGASPLSPSLENRLRLVNLTGNQKALAYVAEHSVDSTCREAAIARLEDANLLAHLALHAADEPSRVAATARIDDIGVLKKLVREARDKRAQRIARDRLKALQQQQDAEQQAAARRAHLLQELDSHAARTLDNLYGARLQQLRGAWDEMAGNASDTEQQRAAAALQRCQSRLDERDQKLAREQEQKQARHEQRAALDTLQQLVDEFRAEQWQELSSVRALVSTQKNRWQAACEITDADTALARRADAMFALWQQALELVEPWQHCDEDEQRQLLRERWPTALPMPISDADGDADALTDASDKDAPDDTSGADNDAAQALRKSLQKVLGTLQKELRQRNLKHANRLWRKAEGLLAEDNAPDWQSRLDKLRPQLDELRDWHAFAAEPKKVQLCERMEALQHDSMDAEEKAGLIHALHDEWRELMSADQESDQALWERFRSASDIAYAPCREHFREVDAQRSANIEKRKTMLAQLQQFVAQQDWENADWPKVFDIRRTAPQEWASYQPVHFTENREPGRQFSAILKQLDEALKQAADRHAATYQQLLEAATALLDDATSRDSIDRWKALQEKWKKAGWLPPNRYRGLHKKFRALGDQLFARLDAERNAHKARIQEETAALRSALDTLRAALEADNATLDLAALQQQANDVMALPCPPKDKLATQRDELVRRVRALKQWQAQWQQWHALAEQLHACGNADSNAGQRELAVAVEFAAGVPSPDEAREERMQWQLQQLQQSMKGGAQDEPLTRVKKLFADATPLLDSGLAADIRQRLQDALNALEPKR